MTNKDESVAEWFVTQSLPALRSMGLMDEFEAGVSELKARYDNGGTSDFWYQTMLLSEKLQQRWKTQKGVKTRRVNWCTQKLQTLAPYEWRSMLSLADELLHHDMLDEWVEQLDDTTGFARAYAVGAGIVNRTERTKGRKKELRRTPAYAQLVEFALVWAQGVNLNGTL
jgi:hypothetical protein